MKNFLKKENGQSEIWAIISILISSIVIMFYLKIVKHKGTKVINVFEKEIQKINKSKNRRK